MRTFKSPTPPDSLVTLQEWFSRAVCAATPDDELSLRKKSSAFLTASSKQGQNERLSIYMSDYWPRCLGSLEEDFPILQRHLKEPAFTQLLRDYLTVCPPQSFTLLFLGKRLPQYLRENYNGSDKALIVDIADFEWAQMEAQAAPNATPFNPDNLNEAQKNQLTDLPLLLHPSVRVLQLDFPVHKPTIHRKKKTQLVVSRPHLTVTHTPVHELFAALLLCFQTPTSISAAIDTLLPTLSKSEVYILETSIQNWIRDCVLHGWFQHPKI